MLAMTMREMIAEQIWNRHYYVPGGPYPTWCDMKDYARPIVPQVSQADAMVAFPVEIRGAMLYVLQTADNIVAMMVGNCDA